MTDAEAPTPPAAITVSQEFAAMLCAYIHKTLDAAYDGASGASLLAGLQGGIQRALTEKPPAEVLPPTEPA